MLSLVLIWRIVNSPFGQILRAIRENEPRTISLGYSVQRFKLAAFVMSAGLTGLAGALKALLFQFATLADVAWQMSGEVILMTLIGGIGTLAGPVVGAGILIGMQNFLATSGLPVTMVLGGTFMVCVLLFRRGVVGEVVNLLERRKGLRTFALPQPLAGRMSPVRNGSTTMVTWATSPMRSPFRRP